MAAASAEPKRCSQAIASSSARPRSCSSSGDAAGRMTTLAPVSVALKFGFLAVLYLFVLWVARSARRDLRRGEEALAAERGAQSPPVPADATGLYSASAVVSAGAAHGAPQLIVERAPG